MCGMNQDSTVTEIVVAVVKNERFFENMTTEEKISSVAGLYRALHHEIVGHDHDHEHSREHDRGRNHEHSHEHDHEHAHK